MGEPVRSLCANEYVRLLLAATPVVEVSPLRKERNLLLKRTRSRCVSSPQGEESPTSLFINPKFTVKLQ